MKLKDFIVIDKEMTAKFAINMDELHLLSFIVLAWEKEVVTITLLLEQYADASPATTHKRLYGLLRNKILKKTVHENDSRIKILEKGERFNDLVKFLKEF